MLRSNSIGLGGAGQAETSFTIYTLGSETIIQPAVFTVISCLLATPAIEQQPKQED